MVNAKSEKAALNLEKYVHDVLSSIEREREREIISRRFGLFDRKETLEQIGELLGITRERVRQLEKSVISKLKTGAENLPHLSEIENVFIEQLSKMGDCSRITNFTPYFAKENTKIDQSRVAFLAELCPKLVVIDEDDYFYHAIGVKAVHDEKAIKTLVNEIIEAIKKINQPTTIQKLAKQTSISNPDQVAALASVSKQLATLNDKWGLIKWPIVNPRNIRDKIYVILKENGKHMHFNEIAAAIKESDFKRKNVTTQAIHNELIKDNRFVLIGRGIYALKEWGYKKGTVSDIISEVLKEAGEPLHRDEIVKRVLKSRFVKETTILLNLQGRPQFKRVAKATYTLDDEAAAK
ncbi:MAG TPA: sigma factor-like helix-turn-helix DNA-binding protein [Patescibacteria group bacterium]|jgi:transcriptional regulator with XRE-family HTH domain|nr:sigma factor-like helix-turn-helix DNA-binding protein [Patescibacteria group bacterium]